MEHLVLLPLQSQKGEGVEHLVLPHLQPPKGEGAVAEEEEAEEAEEDAHER